MVLLRRLPPLQRVSRVREGSERVFLMSHSYLAKRVASLYMRRLLSSYTNVEELAGFPTYVTKDSPVDDKPNGAVRPHEPYPDEHVDWTGHNTGLVTPNVPDDAVRR